LPGNPALPIVAVTVTYNSAEVLPDFLASVFAQTADWRLVVVDNASTDATLELLARIDDHRVVVIPSDRNLGFAAGTNIGIRAALAMAPGGIMLLNNDTIFDAELFAALGEKLAESGAGAVSPAIVFADAPRTIWYAGGRMEWRAGVQNIHEHSEQDLAVLPPDDFATEFCPACCMLFAPSVFTKIGLLDEDFFVYWEDAEFCERMAANGLRIIVSPSLLLRHKASSLTGGETSRFYIEHYVKGRVIFLRKVSPTRRAAMLRTGTVAAAVVRRALLGRDGWSIAGRRLLAVARGARIPLHDAPRVVSS
jgi:GT2 family glycosyltransferase